MDLQISERIDADTVGLRLLFWQSVGMIFRGAHEAQAALSERSPAGTVVTLGTFDGVHLGHFELLRRAKEHARTHGVIVVAYTFDPPPARVLLGDSAPKPLSRTADRVSRLLELGADAVIVEPFHHALASLSADDWISNYLLRARPIHVTVGFNFRFGRGRGGSPKTLEDAGTRGGFGVDIVAPYSIDDGVVSSSRVRGLLEAGDVKAAARLLGCPFSLVGNVVQGAQRGRTIGVPTANLDPGELLVPKPGVYATRTTGAGLTNRPSVTNIGMRPTFAGQSISIETHIMDADVDLYGEELRVEFLERLRDEKKFERFEDLVAQIHVDIERARATF